jgi:hypothetical protein
MARPEPSAAAAAITITVVGSDHGPYAMFDVVAVTTSGATLRGPLLLELGERLTLRVSRSGNSVDVPGRVGGVKKGDGHSEPTTDIVFDDGHGPRLSPIVG